MSGGDAGSAAAYSGEPGHMVVIEGGQLTWCAPGGASRKVVSAGEAAARLRDVGLMGSVPLPPDPDRVGSATPLAGETAAWTVYPGRAVAAVVAAGAAWVFVDARAQWIRLDGDHLAVAAATTGAVTARELEPLVAPGALPQLLSDLAVVGAIGVDEAAEPVVATHVVAEHAPRASTRLARRLRAAVGARPRPAEQAAPAIDAPAYDRSDPTVDGSIPAPPPPGGRERDGRIPVYQFWATTEGPHLGAAAVVAYARVHDDGRLNGTYDFRKADTAANVLADLRTTEGPVVLLCANYVWSLEANLEIAEAARLANPATVVVHGGPSTPRYDADCEAFLRDLRGAHLAISGEGELAFAEVLSALEPRSPGEPLDLTRLDGVAGVRYLDPSTGEVVRNPDRPRHSDLSEFPSALLSGELDLVDDDVLKWVPIPVETNRGCPYACTFCDWGQATMSRIRQFPVDRIEAEFNWLADHGIETWVIADANWGILPRDTEVATSIAAVRARTGRPSFIGAAPPKNATHRYIRIIDTLLAAGISLKVAIALQSRDQATLDAIHRSNIKTATYDLLAVEIRRRGLPLHSELMMGLPGATVESFKNDLQWCIDLQVRPYLYPTFVLPNAPINDPEYRREHAITTVDGLVTATSSYSAADRHEMDRIAFAYQCLEYFGVLRHVLRYLQWDHGMAAMDVVQGVVDEVDADPASFPLLSFLLTSAEDFLLPPAGWAPLLEEARRLLVDRLGVVEDAGLDTAFAVTLHLLPWPGRELPCTVELRHDYLAYFRSATASLAESGAPGVPDRPLVEHGPGRIHIAGDPDDVSGLALGRQQAPGADEYPGFRKSFWVATHLELLSELTVYHPMSPQFLEAAREYFDLTPPGSVPAELDDVPLSAFQDGTVPVSLVRWQPREPARVD